MNISDRFLRLQLELTKPIADASGIDTARAVQDKLGKLMSFINRKKVVVIDKPCGNMRGALTVPRDELRGGIILYLHGGGYISGSLDYAKGFASVLSAECGIRVYSPEYRLAPEHPFPAAIDDAVSAYKELLSEGYNAERIILAGESAGGGLCYSCCRRLMEEGLSLPAGIIAVSPWVDLADSGDSLVYNKSRDPSLSPERLTFYSDCYLGVNPPERKRAKKREGKDEYSELKKNPMASPIYADLSGMPPSLIFAGGDEILLSDSENLKTRLTDCGAQATLVVKQGMWHAYTLYCLKKNKDDFVKMNHFIKQVMPKDNERKLRWLGLDNSAKIYPASATRRWTNVYRLSATLIDDVDKEILQAALDVTVRRFPSIAVRLRRGTFWYYLEEIAHAPKILDEKGYPLSRMPFDDIRSCAFRVIVYKKRIAVEFFHALTDGNGGLVFLKTLLAEYISEKYGADIPATLGVLDRLEEPRPSELEDCFPRFKGPVGKSRKDSNAYRIFGTQEPYGFRHDTVFMMSSDALLDIAHRLGVTVTAVLSAALIKAAINLQRIDTPSLKRQKAVKVLIPVDLRRIFGADTLRNFALYVTPGVDPRLGEYGFDELCRIVYSQMCLDITKKNMSAMIYTNVHDEENMAIKLAPLFLKNLVMKTVFMLVGEKKSTLSLSNLGAIKIPEEMKPYIERFDFVLGVQSDAPYNAGVLSYNGTVYLNIIRNIVEPRLEMSLYRVLRDEGIHVKVESNQKWNGASGEERKDK